MRLSCGPYPSPGALTRLAVIVVLVVAGCGPPQLMPTPNIYARNQRELFVDVPAALQSNRVEVMYLTDRAPEKASLEDPKYGWRRSRSVAFGVSEVQIGKGDLSWEELEKASRTSKREVSLPMSVIRTRELGRFPPTPRTLFDLPPETSTSQPAGTRPTTLKAEHDAAMDEAEAELSARLAATPDKEVYVFIHGYNNSFNDSVLTIAELWHFLGRRGVPVAYSWPAGHGGLLRGYTYDRESSEFTVYHLKQMIRAIAENPDVRKIHLISHSRGTGVLTSALQELHLEIGSCAGRSTREVLKLGTVVLAAPDIDCDVVIQRMATARVGRVPERLALYVCAKDSALGISNWLFGGTARLGKLQSNVFTAEELEALRKSKTVQIVDARISNAGSFGHDYFKSNPAVSSDLILLMRYQLAPGAESGRPLGVTPGGFWYVDNDYPRAPKTTGDAPSGK